MTKVVKISSEKVAPTCTCCLSKNMTFRPAKWQDDGPEPILENNCVKVLWNFPVQTDHTVRHNKPEILVFEKKSQSAIIIDIDVPANVTWQENELKKFKTI